MTAVAAAPPLDVDWTRCDGHGVCAALLPGAITRDDWGYPLIDADAAAMAGPGALNRVVTACPALALRRTEAGTRWTEAGTRRTGAGTRRTAAGTGRLPG